MSFAQAEYADKKKVTRRERFLGEMNQVVPWARLVALVEPHYPSGQRGRPPIDSDGTDANLSGQRGRLA